MQQTALVTDSRKLESIGRRFDTIICGSDQIWAPNALNPVYLIDFAPKKTEKVSYAASIGLNDIPLEIQPVYRHALADFKRVSVREEKSVEILKKYCGTQAEVVLDPTLLLTEKEWERHLYYADTAKSSI